MHRSRRRLVALAALTALLTLVIVSGPVQAGTGSLQLLGTSTDDHWSGWTSFSADGSRVAFQSDVDGQVYVEDLATRQRLLVSTADGVTGADQWAGSPAISRNGRFVTFVTAAANLSPGNTDYLDDVYLKDTVTGALTLVSATSSGQRGLGASEGPAPVSDDGTVVVFTSSAANFAPVVALPAGCPDPENGSCPYVETEVYAKNVATGELSLVSLGSRGDGRGATVSARTALSSDGSTVAFSTGDTMTADDLDGGFGDVVMKDLGSGAVRLVSNDHASEASSFYQPVISDDGTVVAYQGQVGPDINTYARDLAAVSPVLLSRNGDGQAGDEVSQEPAISADGRYVAFQSRASNLLPEDADHVDDVYLADRDSGDLTLVSRTDSGAKGNDASFAVASLAGPAVIFGSLARNLDPAVGSPGEFGYFLKQVASTPPPDANGDGVLDVLQPAGTATGAFVDATTSPATTGSIVDANGLAVTVTDATDPADGVLVTTGPGSGQATLAVCGLTVRLGAASSAVLTCGSVVVRTLSGVTTVETDGGFISVAIPAGAAAEVADTTAGATVRGVTDGTVTVTVNGSTTSVAAGSTLQSFNAWVVSAFRDPVDAAPVTNVMKAGRAVPLKWHVADSSGQPVTTLTSVAVSVAHLACGLGTTTDVVEQTTAGGSGLQNLGGGDYQLSWKTNVSWARSCKTMTLDLGGGVTAMALFAFTK